MVEVGSNDGYLLEQFRIRVNASWELMLLLHGQACRGARHYHRTKLFLPPLAEAVKQEHGRARLVIANNVFNHPTMFLDLLKPLAIYSPMTEASYSNCRIGI